MTAMLKGWMVAVFAASVALIGAFTAAAEQPALAETASEGYKVYIDYGCAQCHGTVGQGSISTPALPPGYPVQALLAKLRSKSGAMPVYSQKVMSDRQVALVAAYLASLPPWQPASEIPALSD